MDNKLILFVHHLIQFKVLHGWLTTETVTGQIRSYLPSLILHYSFSLKLMMHKIWSLELIRNNYFLSRIRHKEMNEWRKRFSGLLSTLLVVVNMLKSYFTLRFLHHYWWHMKLFRQIGLFMQKLLHRNSPLRVSKKNEQNQCQDVMQTKKKKHKPVHFQLQSLKHFLFK